MKERPILMNGAMVRATLAGNKTQTRRMIKLPHENALGQWEPSTIGGELGGRTAGGDEIPVQGVIWHMRTGDCLASPYGQPGDRLWVRETFYAYGRWETRFSAKKKRDEWHFVDMTAECDRRYQYAADNPDVPLAKGRGGAQPGWYTRPAIFMPRAACRILLGITGVRVERLNECSAADARAEGLISYEHSWRDSEYPLPDIAYEPFKGSPVRPSEPVAAYAALWESINGAGSWAANPWVWRVEFSRVTP